MTAMWKQDTSLHPTFARLNRCLADDWFLLPYELRLQRASAMALVAASILSADEREQIDRALDEIARQFTAAACPDSPAEDIHTWLEVELTRRAGPAGQKIHTARSRNDQVATLLGLFVIDAGSRLAGRLDALVALLARRAKSWAEQPMPMMTHTQLAAPGTAGFWALRHAVAFDRLRTAFEAYLSQWQRYCPLGAGAVAGSSIAIDRNMLARELGFERPSRSALDDTTTRDDCIELLALAAQAAIHLQSFAADVILFSQTPLRWVRYPAAFATGSSMMPNKLNPDAMELLRGESAALPAAHHHALMLLRNLPSGYNRDLQCIKPIVRDAAARLDGLLEMTHAFVESMDFDARRLADAMQDADLYATLHMEQRVREGMALREAHHAVAEEVQRRRKSTAVEAPATVTTPPKATAGAAAPSDPSGAMDPIDAVRRYQTAGSAAPPPTIRLADELLAGRRAGG